MDYKYGLTESGMLVSLPTKDKIIWKFISYPDTEFALLIYQAIKG